MSYSEEDMGTESSPTTINGQDKMHRVENMCVSKRTKKGGDSIKFHLKSVIH